VDAQVGTCRQQGQQDNPRAAAADREDLENIEAGARELAD
jgi:hypothetical protein